MSMNKIFAIQFRKYLAEFEISKSDLKSFLNLISTYCIVEKY